MAYPLRSPLDPILDPAQDNTDSGPLVMRNYGIGSTEPAPTAMTNYGIGSTQTSPLIPQTSSHSRVIASVPQTEDQIVAAGGVPPSWEEKYLQPEPPPEKGFVGKLGQALGGGVDTLMGNLKATGNLYMGDYAGVEANAKKAQEQAANRPKEQQAFGQAMAALPDNPGLIEGIKGMAGAIWEQPQGALQEFVAQAPNSAAVMGGMAAGGALGSAILPGIGTAVGAILGGFLGNLGIETGARLMDSGADGLTDAEAKQAMSEGALKAAGVTGVDMATLGATRWLMGAPSRAASKAIMGSLTKAGVDVADDAAVSAAMQTMGVGSEALLQGARAMARATGRAPIMTLASAGLETVGEGAGEYLGEVMATGQGNMKEALLESIMAAPMSAGEIVWAKSDANQPFKLGTALERATGTDLSDPKAVDNYINTNLPHFAALSLDQDQLGIISKDEAMQALGNPNASPLQRINAVAGIAADIATRQNLPAVSEAWLERAKSLMANGEVIKVPGYTQPIPAYQEQQKADRKQEKPITPPSGTAPKPIIPNRMEEQQTTGMIPRKSPLEVLAPIGDSAIVTPEKQEVSAPIVATAPVPDATPERPPFVPTHTTSDGVPVRQIDGNEYEDANGDTIVDDYADKLTPQEAQGMRRASTADIAKQLQEEQDSINARQQFAKTNDGIPFSAPMRNQPQKTVMVTPSAQQPGKWQITYLDKNGEPSGDSQANSYSEAVDVAHQYGANWDQVALSGQPSEPVAAQEAPPVATSSIEKPSSGMQQKLAQNREEAKQSPTTPALNRNEGESYRDWAARSWVALQTKPTDGSWDSSVIENTANRVIKPLAQKLDKGGWSTLDNLTPTNRSSRDPRRSISRHLEEMKQQGLVQIAWDNQGNSHWSKSGTSLPNWLTTSTDEQAIASLSPKPANAIQSRLQENRAQQEAQAAPAPWEMTKDEYVATTTPKDPRDSSFTKAINRKDVEARGDGIYYVPAKVATPQFLNRLKTQQERASLTGRVTPTNQFEFKPWSEVTGDTTSAEASGYAILDRRARQNERIGNDHRAAVQQALAEGKSIPTSVLKDYPDLTVSQETANEPQAVETQPPAINPKKQTPIFTPDGKRFSAQWDVVEADSLSPTLTTGENQPRDRNRIGSDLQIQTIANNPDFKRLSDIGQTMDVGAPTMTREGVIVGGNGRVAGVTRSYNIGKAQGYRQALIDRADEFGADPAQIAGMSKPVLVRRLQEPVDTRAMALASNKPQGLAMGSTETAKVDAERMRNLGQIEVTDTGDIATNADNIAKLRDSLSDYDITEQAGFIDGTGNISADGLRRVRNAILHKAYGDSPVITRLLETADPDLKNVGTALVRAGGKMAEMNDVINRGDVPSDYAIATDVSQAIETLSRLRQNKVPLAEHLSQQNLFGEQHSPAEKRILQFLDENGRSAKAITSFLEDYADRVISSQGIGQDLFGATITPPTKDQVLTDVARSNTRTAPIPSGDLFTPTPAQQVASKPQDAGNNAPGNRVLGGETASGGVTGATTTAAVTPANTQATPTRQTATDAIRLPDQTAIPEAPAVSTKPPAVSDLQYVKLNARDPVTKRIRDEDRGHMAVRYETPDGVINVGEIIDHRAAYGDTTTSQPWETSDGQRHMNLAAAKKHELVTQVIPKLQRDGYLAPEAAPAAATAQAPAPAVTATPELSASTSAAPKARTAYDLTDKEYQEVVADARYLKDVAYSIGNLLGNDKKAILRIGLSKSTRDNILMDALNIDRDLAHTINNGLDDKEVHNLRKQDMEEALVKFPMLKKLVDEHAPKPSSTNQQPTPETKVESTTEVNTLNQQDEDLQTAQEIRRAIEAARRNPDRTIKSVNELFPVTIEHNGIKRNVLARTHRFNPSGPDVFYFRYLTDARFGLAWDVYRLTSKNKLEFWKQEHFNANNENDVAAKAIWEQAGFALPKSAESKPTESAKPTASDKQQFEEKAAAPDREIDSILPSDKPDSQSLLNDVLDEEFGATPVAKPRATRKPRTAKAPPATKPTVAEAAGSAVKNFSEASTQALKGIAALFDPGKGTLGSGPVFNEDTWAKAKPLFVQAVQGYQASWQDIKEVIRAIVRALRELGLKREGVEAMSPYITRFADEVRDGVIILGGDNVQSTDTDAQGDSGATGDGEQVNQADVEHGTGTAATTSGRNGEQAGGAGIRPVGHRGLSGTGTAVEGEPSGDGIPSAKGRLDDGQRTSRPGERDRGSRPGDTGVAPGRQRAAATAGVTDAARALAEKTAITPADLDNIRTTLPQLLPSQQEDVQRAEQRFHTQNQLGMLFTNATGTGKGFLGLGIVKRMARQGKTNIIITAPGEKIIDDWINAAKKFGLEIRKLADTKDAGQDGEIVITTYANFGQNDALVKRDWDLVVHDEAHYLMQDKDGTPTASLRKSRALTGHPDGALTYTEAMERDLVQQIADLKKASSFALTRERERLIEVLREREKVHAANRAELWRRKGTRRLDLSATPFAYETSIKAYEGFLFDFDRSQDNQGGYNKPNAFGDFMVRHFGWRMRYGKLTSPEASVDSGVMQRQFNRWLKQIGALSSRRLSVEQDYSREFIAVESLVGRQIDEGYDYIRERAYDRDNPLAEGYGMMLENLEERFPYHERIRLLEAIKAPFAVERARKHLALGRKVVIFHSRIQGGSVHPFKFSSGVEGGVYDRAIRDFKEQHPELVNLDLGGLTRPLDLFKNEFGDRVTFYNGTVSSKDKRNNPTKFNYDDGGVDVIVVQDDAGKEGISLHDTTGNKQRVLINIGLPIKPTQAIQIEGRIFRVGQASDAIFEYFNTGTTFERFTFATKISERASVAENMAMGDEARRLRDSFVDAFENPNDNPPSLEQGKGGKAADTAMESAVTPFQEAKTHYFANLKNTKRRDQREGIDYFATPEPLGLKMVEWSGMRPNDAALEPSAGHGAIARYFPESVRATFVEPSSELMSRLALRTNGKLRQQRFEEMDEAANKFDAIIMNPPYGTGGATARDHLAKAMNHLNNGGRIVALIPEGPAADAKFGALLYGSDNESVAAMKESLKKATGENATRLRQRIHQLTNFHVRASISLPPVVFERAGTAVKTRVLIIDRLDKGGSRLGDSTREIDATNIKDFFDRIEEMSVYDRPPSPMEASEVLANNGITVSEQDTGFYVMGTKYEQAELLRPIMRKHQGQWNGLSKYWFTTTDPSEDLAKALQGETVEGLVTEQPAPVTDNPDIISHTTQAGKVIRGVVRTDMNADQAKAIDPYTFRKNGGWFIREAHLSKLAERDTPVFSKTKQPGTSGASPTAVRAAVNRITSKWANAPRMVVFTGMDDPQVDEAVRKEYARQTKERLASDPNATPDQVDAFYYRGTVYINSESIANAKDLERALRHETLGHAGLRALFGNSLNGILDQVIAGQNAAVIAKAKQRGLNMSNTNEARTAAEEVLAELSETRPNLSVVRRAVALIRRLLRDMGVSLSLSNNDIIAEYLIPARNFIERGNPGYFGLSDALAFAIRTNTGQSGLFLSNTNIDYEKYAARSGSDADRELVNARITSSMDKMGVVYPQRYSVMNREGPHFGLNLWKPGDEIVTTKQGINNALSNIRGRSALSGQYAYPIYESEASYLQGEGLRPFFADGGWWFDAVSTINGAYAGYAATKGINQEVGNILRRVDRRTPDVWKVEHAPLPKTASEYPVKQTNPDIRFSLSPRQNTTLDSAWQKLNLAPEKQKTLTEHVQTLLGKNWRQAMNDFKANAYEGLFDGLINIDRAEKEVGITKPEQSGYVSARMATGIADTLWGVLNKGAPEWRNGVLAYKRGTKGLLTVLGDLGPDMRDWLGWMAGNRANELMAQGRENNLEQAEIDELLALATPDKANKFMEAKAAYNALNSAMLDVAEQAGLINPQSRSQWESEWYVPFYRQLEIDGDATLLGPHTTRGLSHQTSGIRALKGGSAPTADLLTNILTNWTKLVDASMKNHALSQVADNLNGTRFMVDETTKWKQVLVSKPEMIKRLKESPELVREMADWLGLPNGDIVYTLNEIKRMTRGEMEKLWTKVAPTDKEVIRIQRDGKNYYYRVLDPALLRSIESFGFQGFSDPMTRTARTFKRLLTTGVTSMPDFIIRNFVRDAVHSWAINKDGMKFASDAVKGIRKTYGESDAYWDLVFSGGSFQGGYVHGTDPEASAQIVRRSLGRKGLSPSQIEARERGVLATKDRIIDVLDKYWERYRSWGDKAENVNRLATYEAAIAAGKSPLQAAYEAKDLMDYSLRGNYQMLMRFTDMVPFLNARIQGLGKLGRAGMADPRIVGMKVAKIAAFSVALAMLNGDDDRYKKLEDWEKDAYWHFWLGDEHFRIPKPFEIGVLAGTMPERMWNTFIAGNQENDKMWWSVKHNILGTFSFNPIPQVALPIIENVANRSFFFDRPIENMSDLGQLPFNRFDSRTSDTMRVLGSWLGASPKQLEHLTQGYLGTLGSYVMFLSDAVVRWAEGAPSKPDWTAADIPVLKSFFRGSGPARNTAYATDLFDAFKEVEMIHRTITDMRKEGRREDAQALQARSTEKLRFRPQILSAKKRLDEIRRQIDIISGSSLSGTMKRQRIDRLTIEKNRLSERVANQIAPAF